MKTIEQQVEEFELLANDSEMYGCDSFFFEEGEFVRFDQEKAGKWLTQALQERDRIAREEERERLLNEVLCVHHEMCWSGDTGCVAFEDYLNGKEEKPLTPNKK